MNDTAVNVEMLKIITIDPDFESVCPPLTKDEFSLLEQNILSDGEVTTPLVVWNNILIDGHHRRQIILKHPEISFSIKEVDFEDRYVAEAWICKNQIGKRNLTPEQRTYILGKRYKAEKHTDGAADGFRGNQHEKLVVGKIYPLPEKQPISEKCPPPERPRTSERIAKESKVSEKAVRLAEKYSDGVDAAEAACPGIKGELLSGAIKPTRQDVISIANLPEEERPEAIANLRRANELKKEKMLKAREERRKKADAGEEAERVYSSIGELSASMAEPKPRNTVSNVVGIISDQAQILVATCESYIAEFPELMEKDKPMLSQALGELREYLKAIFKED